MAKKKQKEEEEVPVEETPVDESKPKKVEEKPVKKTLIDLIDEMEDSTLIFEKLMEHGYYNQYKNELRLKEQGRFVAPSMTVEEFNKITK